MYDQGTIMDGSELRIEHIATRDCAMPLRHALSAFLQALDLESYFCADVLSAAGEALANALEHAYKGNAVGTVREENAEKILVAIRDYGTFIVHEPNSDRGFGMPIMRAMAGAVSIETGNGTRVQLLFDTSEKHGCVSAYEAVAS
jgi:serine/threonine-protein kinase RsbW